MYKSHLCMVLQMHRVSSACRDRPFSGLMIAELKSMKKDFDEQVKYSGKPDCQAI